MAHCSRLPQHALAPLLETMLGDLTRDQRFELVGLKSIQHASACTREGWRVAVSARLKGGASRC